MNPPSTPHTHRVSASISVSALIALGLTLLSPTAVAAPVKSPPTQAAQIISRTTELMRNGFTITYTSPTSGKGTLSAPAAKAKEQPLRYYSDILEVNTWSSSKATLIQLPANAATAPLRTGKNRYAWVGSNTGFKNPPGWLGTAAVLNSSGTPDQIAMLAVFDSVTNGTFTGSIPKGEYPYLANDAFAPILDSDLDVRMTTKNGALSTLSLTSQTNRNRSITMKFLSLGKPGAAYPSAASIVNHQQAVAIVNNTIGPRALAGKVLGTPSKNIETALNSLAKTKSFTDLDLQFGRTTTGWVLFGGPSYPDEPVATDADMMRKAELNKSWCIDTTSVKPLARACTIDDKALLTGLFKPWGDSIISVVNDPTFPAKEKYYFLMNLGDNMWAFGPRPNPLHSAPKAESGAFYWLSATVFMPWYNFG